MPQRGPSEDERWMRRALRLAHRGLGAVEPNPAVGCVLVKNHHMVAEGWHRRFGGAHAEVDALRRADDPRGATAYVTLEPCAHHGKTPPCVRALLEAGIARVVIGTRDPNPRVVGGGAQALRNADVDVTLGVCEAAATALIAPFRKLVTRGRPWVILKWAQSLDGKIATASGASRWITGEAARRHVHTVRGRVDAVLAGVNTVLSDDPQLTARHGRPRRRATRVVLDTHLRTPATAALVQTAGACTTWLFCGPDAPVSREHALTAQGCRVTRVALDAASQRVALEPILDALGKAAMTNLVVEGGAHVLGAFLAARQFDEVQVYTAPIIIGGAAAPGPFATGVLALDDAPRLTLMAERRVGADLWRQFRFRGA